MQVIDVDLFAFLYMLTSSLTSTLNINEQRSREQEELREFLLIPKVLFRVETDK